MRKTVKKKKFSTVLYASPYARVVVRLIGSGVASVIAELIINCNKKSHERQELLKIQSKLKSHRVLHSSSSTYRAAFGVRFTLGNTRRTVHQRGPNVVGDQWSRVF